MVGLVLVVLLALPTLPAQAARQPALRRYQTPDYIIHTDLDGLAAREAALRLTRMAAEYRQRLASLGCIPRQRLPLYLFGDEGDYLAAGGLRGSRGYFTGEKLMAWTGTQRPDARTWHAIQHEGFHQFAAASGIGGANLPVWVSEGLADYFGESLFTGDGFVSGVIPPWRLARLRQSLAENRTLPIEQLLDLSRPQWNADLSVRRYDQAWSMVQFLAHADGGRYQPAFWQFIRAVSEGTPWRQAWEQNLGPDRNAFEKQWRDYWMALDEHPTATLYAQATAATLASFLARAHAQGQRFESFEAFVEMAQERKLKIASQQWLPPALLEEAIQAASQSGRWSIDRGDNGLPVVVVELPQARVVAGFTLGEGKPPQVVAEAQPTSRPVHP